jgi:hypothetical protein
LGEKSGGSAGGGCDHSHAAVWELTLIVACFAFDLDDLDWKVVTVDTQAVTGERPY